MSYELRYGAFTYWETYETKHWNCRANLFLAFHLWPIKMSNCELSQILFLEILLYKGLHLTISYISFPYQSTHFLIGASPPSIKSGEIWSLASQTMNECALALSSGEGRVQLGAG